MGGGNADRGMVVTMAKALSPRGRGKRVKGTDFARNKGSIPAWAGETGFSCPACRITTVYPRVGGGNLQHSDRLATEAGLSPRGRGKPRG